jgi:hypothetical protein
LCIFSFARRDYFAGVPNRKEKDRKLKCSVFDFPAGVDTAPMSICAPRGTVIYGLTADGRKIRLAEEDAQGKTRFYPPQGINLTGVEYIFIGGGGGGGDALGGESSYVQD